jgi:hypothetical protein
VRFLSRRVIQVSTKIESAVNCSFFGEAMPPKLTPEIITAAIEGFEFQKRRIDGQIAELRAMLPGSSAETAAAPEAPIRKRKKLSAAARKRMKEAQQRRWAKIRREPEPPATPEPEKPKRKLSAAGRAAIVAATKKRWALKRAETKKAAPARKKATARKTAVNSAPAKAAKKASVKKAAAKKMAPPPALRSAQ